MSKPKRKSQKTKLKTMEEISAADAQKLFHDARDSGDHMLTCPKHMQARSFFETGILYEEFMARGVINCEVRSGNDEMRSQRECSPKMEESAKATGMFTNTKNLSAKDLDELPPAQRKIVDLIRENPRILDKEIATKLGRKTKTISNELLTLRKKLGAKNRKELAAMLPPPSGPTTS